MWAAAAIAVVVVGWAVFREREPRYQGKTLSEWMTVAGHTDDDREQGKAVEEALEKIGTNGLPWMIEWLRYEEPKWRSTLCGLVGGLPRALVPNLIINYLVNDKQRERADWAAEMLALLGPMATNSIPQLVGILNDTNALDSSERAAVALASLGRDGLPPLLAALSDRQHSNRAAIARATANLETNAGPAVAVLLACLQEGKMDLTEAAIEVLGELKLEPEKVVPELTRGLTNGDYRIRIKSAEALLRFGKSANAAVPRLLEGLDDDDAAARGAAERALQEIAPEKLEKDKRIRTHKPPKVFWSDAPCQAMPVQGRERESPTK